MSHTLIVARMNPESAAEVSRLFAESDAGELPHLLGVRERHLFRFHGLYMHLIESEPGIGERLQRIRDEEIFQNLNEKLNPLIAAYDPASWRGPRDAMAVPFYSWQNQS